jgi:hypothetical protein
VQAEFHGEDVVNCNNLIISSLNCLTMKGNIFNQSVTSSLIFKECESKIATSLAKLNPEAHCQWKQDDILYLLRMFHTCPVSDHNELLRKVTTTAQTEKSPDFLQDIVKVYSNVMMLISQLFLILNINI